MDGAQALDALDTPRQARIATRPTASPGTAVDRFTAVADELFSCAYRAAYKILGDAGSSEDVAQEALIRALARWAKIESYAPAWTTRVAANLAIDEWRKRRADPDDAIDLPQADHTDEIHVRDELNRALMLISPRRREAIVLRFLCDLSPGDTAQVMKTSVHGVLKHTVRGLADLRRLMGGPPADEPVLDDPVHTSAAVVSAQRVASKPGRAGGLRDGRVRRQAPLMPPITWVAATV